MSLTRTRTRQLSPLAQAIFKGYCRFAEQAEDILTFTDDAGDRVDRAMIALAMHEEMIRRGPGIEPAKSFTDAAAELVAALNTEGVGR